MAYKDPNKKQRDLLFQQTPRGRYIRYKSTAKGRGWDFQLTFEEFMVFWQEPCVYCGSFIKTIGLDRVDSLKGYSVSNVVPCCVVCNRMKSNYPITDFIRHCEKIVAYKV